MRNFIKNVNQNDIKSFKASDDRQKVIVTLKNGGSIEFNIKNGFGVFFFYELMEELSGEKTIKTVFTDVNGYVGIANNVMTDIYIKNILTDVGSDALSMDVRCVMLDGFDTNLFTLAEQENDLKKYVLVALELLNELNGDTNAVYTNKYRRRVLKVGV